MTRGHRTGVVGTVAAVIGTAAALASGYAAAGQAGLVDVASAAAVAVLIVARGLVRGEKPPSVPFKKIRLRRPAPPTAEFPGYQKIFSDLSWAQVSWRHYQHPVRPMLARLAAALDRQEAVADDLAASRDPDAPGPGLAALDRIVAKLEGHSP
jgi:hypothetical protein